MTGFLPEKILIFINTFNPIAIKFRGDFLKNGCP